MHLKKLSVSNEQLGQFSVYSTKTLDELDERVTDTGRDFQILGPG